MASEPLDALIVGAGISGLSQLYNLRKLGIKVKVVEQSSNIGGIWFWNSYPGFRVDTISPLYNLAIDEVNKDWTWSEAFPTRDEVLRYLEHAASVLDVGKDVELNTTVVSAEYDEPSNTWRVKVERNGEVETITTHFLILCVGPAAKKYVPDIKGLDSFQGEWHHTSAWPQEIDYHNKKVAVIGTGASGVQVIQEMAPHTSRLTIFQRTPNLCLPIRQSSLSSSSQLQYFLDGLLSSELNSRPNSYSGFNMNYSPKSALDDNPEERRKFYEELWVSGWFRFLVEGYKDYLLNVEANQFAYEFWVNKTRARIQDPKKRDLLAPLSPPHPLGAKRPAIEGTYFEVCDQPNVDIVDIKSSPINFISPSSIITKDGVEHGPYDIIVLATGYDMLRGSILNIEIKGKEGVTLKKKWEEEGIKTNLGIATNGFPNMFIIFGPQSPTTFSNAPPLIESQTKWVADCIQYLKQRGIKKIETKREEEEKWSEGVTERMNKTLLAGTEGWYMGSNIPGKKREALGFVGGLDLYLRFCNDAAENNYSGFELK